MPIAIAPTLCCRGQKMRSYIRNHLGNIIPRPRVLLALTFVLTALFLCSQFYQEIRLPSFPIRFVFVKKVLPPRAERTVRDSTKVYFEGNPGVKKALLLKYVGGGYQADIKGQRSEPGHDSGRGAFHDTATPEPFLSAQGDSRDFRGTHVERIKIERDNQTIPLRIRGTWSRKDLEYQSGSGQPEVGNASAERQRQVPREAKTETNGRVKIKEDQVNDILEDFGVVPAVNLKAEKPEPAQVVYVNHYWQVVQDAAEIYLYSSYYDDRRILDEPLVRILAVAEIPIGLLACLHWYPRQQNPDVAMVSVESIGPRISPHGGTKYGQFLFSCQVVDGKGPPEHVTVITTTNMKPSTLLPVQIPERPRRKIDFGHCMSVAYWKQDPFKVVEWLELHRMWGVGEVTVYNNSLDDVTSFIFQSYAKEGFVDFRQAPNAVGGQDSELAILLNMSPVINDCLYRNMYRYRWVVCTDLDEYIVPRIHSNYEDLIRAINADAKRQRPAKSYMFNNVYFFNDLGAVRRDPWYLWTQRFLRHVDPSPFGYSSKSITDPRACVGLQNHLCWRRAPRFEGMATAWNLDVNQSLAMNYHYKKCHLDQYEGTFGLCKDAMKTYKVDETMLKFGEELYNKVTAKLLELDLIEEEEEGDNVAPSPPAIRSRYGKHPAR